MGILLSEAGKTADAAAGGMGGLGMLLVWGVFIVFMFLMMTGPQKKEQKRLKAMLSTMEIGDSVYTTSGFYGMVIDISEDSVIVEFGNNKNCRIPMSKNAIAQVEKPGAE